MTRYRIETNEENQWTQKQKRVVEVEADSAEAALILASNIFEDNESDEAEVLESTLHNEGGVRVIDWPVELGDSESES